MIRRKYVITILSIISIFILPLSIYANANEVIDRGRATIDGVSVRSSNSVGSKYLGTLRTGDKIEIIEKTNNGWYKINYKDSYAYVGDDFIRLSSTKTVDNVLNSGIVYKASKLTVRESCSNKSKLLGYLPKDEKVEIVRATSTNWYKIKYEGSYAYVESKYIKLNQSDIKNDSNEIEISNLNNFLFIGDSFTQRMTDTIKSQNDKVYVHAQGGSRPSYWLDKVDEMPNKEDIEAISLLIGVNGINESNNIRDTKALINQLIIKYPNKKIYIQKVFPVGIEFIENNPINHNKLIDEYNKKLEEFCDTKENIKFIDTTNGFVNKDGYLIYTSDGLHIDLDKNLDFYKNIFSSIKKTKEN